MSCTRSQEFLAKNKITATETVDAKAKLGAKDAWKLASAAGTVIVAKGKKVVTFSMKKDAPKEDVLLPHMLGPTGNLRAPTIRKGKTVLVGFNEELFEKIFG